MGHWAPEASDSDSPPWKSSDGGSPTASGEVSSSAIINLHFRDEKTEVQVENPKSLIRLMAEQGRSPDPLGALPYPHPGLSHCPTLPSSHSVGTGQPAGAEEEIK